VGVFNDSKRFDAVKSQLVNLARLGNPEWKRLSVEEVLRELNLVANPTYIHLAGNWQFTTVGGEVLSLNGFSPSVGFPAAQIASIQTVAVHADSVLCIENLTSFHQYTQTQHETLRSIPLGRNIQYAVICTYGNPSPAIRRLLRLIPYETKIYLWSDMDYGGFNILSQLRRTVDTRIQPHQMDIETLEANVLRSRPFTVSDRANFKRLLLRPELRDVHPVIEHLLQRGLKLEQEGIENQR
jgi:DNA topoisomerase VI subunit A